MRLIRLLLSLSILVALIYVAVAVPLGRRTLWEHLRAIAGSQETKELVDDVKQKAGSVLHHDAGAAKATGDELTSKERRLLRKLIKEKLHDSSN